MKMRKVFFLVLICFLMASLIAEAQIIEVGITAGFFDTLELSFNDASALDWWVMFKGKDSTTISWDGIGQMPGATEGAPDAYLVSSIYALQVQSSTSWDLTITMPAALTTVDNYSSPLTWQFSTSSTLAGADYISGSITRKGLSYGNYTWYLRFRIAYHLGIAPGDYQGTGSIVAAML